MSSYPKLGGQVNSEYGLKMASVWVCETSLLGLFLFLTPQTTLWLDFH